MKRNKRYSDREWSEIASSLSGENQGISDLTERFISEDGSDAVTKWKEIKMMGDDRVIDVDKAWNNVHTRIVTEETATEKPTGKVIFLRRTLLRVAAVAAVIVTLGIASLWLAEPNTFSRKITIATSSEQKNIKIDLPDGSSIVLNRNSELSYRKNFGTRDRKVNLKGEAFFDIAPDKAKPFVIDAGKANIKVVGTSFNVISNNDESAVEVFVKTGRVMLSNSSGNKSIALEPGYIGTMGTKSSDKKLNANPNYLAWKTGFLVYNGQKLDIVFNDLKKVFNMAIIADDPSILEDRWTTSPIDNQSQDTIIKLICKSFNLNYTRDGNLYHLSRK